MDKNIKEKTAFLFIGVLLPMFLFALSYVPAYLLASFLFNLSSGGVIIMLLPVPWICYLLYRCCMFISQGSERLIVVTSVLLAFAYYGFWAYLTLGIRRGF